MTNFTGTGKSVGVWQDPDTKLFFGILGKKNGDLLETTSFGYENESQAFDAMMVLVLAAEATNQCT